VALHGFHGVLKSKGDRANTLIVGSGFSGAQIAREMLQNNNPYIPVGFIDDDPSQWKIKVHGVKVLGASRDIPRLVEEYAVEKILIALPDADSAEIRRIVGIIRETRIQDQIKILPSTTALINGKASLSDLHDIQLNDLLGRAPVRIDFHVIQRFIQNRTVLITGAAGSIGSELAKTVLRFKPRSAVLVEIDETELFNLANDLGEHKDRIVPVVGDVRDEEKMTRIFKKFAPQIVLHAAAYKHVPILEFYPEEAVRTNIAGTRNIAQAALRGGVERFIFISTDKAINPTSVMGATKRACEEMLKVLDREGPTHFISVRFGNVLGSRGSVIPVFREQIKRGGPVTVTHPEMKRYFMITSEAVLLVLEAAAIGNGGDVFVLDMGEQIKIIDLAREIIRISGYEPDKDIPIVYTGRRPGEKLSEEIFSAEEGVENTEYAKLLKARSSSLRPQEALLEKIERLVESSGSEKRAVLIQHLRKIVPTYTPYESGQSSISMIMKG
jgi:FlaA1/EpsC-like NDP-sugar epimerase